MEDLHVCVRFVQDVFLFRFLFGQVVFLSVQEIFLSLQEVCLLSQSVSVFAKGVPVSETGLIVLARGSNWFVSFRKRSARSLFVSAIGLRDVCLFSQEVCEMCLFLEEVCEMFIYFRKRFARCMFASSRKICAWF